MEIRLADGTLLILDAGTGIRELGVELAGNAGRPIHLVLTHLHLDHLEGLGFFVPLWQPETELHIWGPVSGRLSLRSRIAGFLAPPFFPVLLADAVLRREAQDARDGASIARLLNDPAKA